MFDGHGTRSIRFRTALLILFFALLTPALLGGCGGVSDGSLGGDSPAINLLPGTIMFSENGGSGSFSISLATAPNDLVVLEIENPDEDALIVNPKTVTFTSSNWKTPQVIQLHGIDDDEIDGNQKYQITVSVKQPAENSAGTKDTTGYRKLESVTQEVTVLDDDQAAIAVDPSGTLSISEGEAGFFNVRLNSIPDGDVVVDISSADPSEVAIDTSSPLTFTADTWDEAQRVYLSGVPDYQMDDSQEVRITLQVNTEATTDTTGYQELEAGAVTVKVLDADTPGVSVSPTSLGTIPEAGDPATFGVRLTTVPDGNVVIAVASNDPDQATVTPQILTFSRENWNTEQVVTVNGVDDHVADGNQPVTISLDIDSDGTTDTTGYEEVEIPNVSVTIADDMAGVTAIPGTTTFSEDGSDDKGSFLVVLNSKPNGNVVLDVESQDTSEATADKSQLTFTSANWSNRQTVLLSPVDDDLVDGNTNFKIVIMVNKGLTTDTTGYADLPDGTVASVPITVIDNDRAGVTVEPETLTLSENGGAETFSVRLNSQPNGSVVIRTASTDASEATTDVDTLLFTDENWSSKKYVTVSGVDDFDVDENQTVTVTVSVDPDETTDTTGYTDLAPTDVKDVHVTVTDDDEVGVTVSPTTLPFFSENGGSEEFSVQLNTIPDGTVVFDILSPNPDQVAVDKATLSFNHLTWSTPQKVLVSGVNNEDIDSNRTRTVIVDINPASTTDTTGYLNVDPDDVTVQIQDDDAAGITASPTALSLPEMEGTATFTVTLDNQPLGEVLLDITSGDETIATVDKDQLTFNSTNWQTAQGVTVSAVDDPEGVENRSTTIQIGVQSAPDDPVYQSVAAEEILVTVLNVALEPAAAAEGQ